MLQDKVFIGISYVLLFVSAYLLLIYFEEHSVYRFFLLGLFVFSIVVISTKVVFLKLKLKAWFVFFVVVLAATTEILNDMYYGLAIFYTNFLFFFTAAIVGYALTHLYIPKKSLFIIIFSILLGLMFFILRYEIMYGVRALSYLSNRNLLSMVSIPVLVVLFVQYQQNRFESPYVLLIATALGLVLSIMAVGRSGIITSSIMFAAALIATISCGKGKSYINKVGMKIIFILLFSALMFFIFIMFFDYIYAKFSYFRSSGLTDSARSGIILQYFESLTFSNFFSGTNYRELSSFGGNLHNTYLTYHGNYGVFGMIIFLMFFYSIAKTAWNKEVFMTLVFLSFSLRILTDTGNDFFTHLGIFTTVFYGLRTKQTIRKDFNQFRTQFFSLKMM
jgi:hypothetical protein